jgi:hypothetical protein
MEALTFMVFPLLQHLPDIVTDLAKTRTAKLKAAIRAVELLGRIPRAGRVATL